MNIVAMRIYLGLSLFLAGLVCVACNRSQVETTPTAAVTAMVTTTPTGTLTISVTAGLMVTVTSIPAALLIVRDALNIRSGPGVNYPVAGFFARGAETNILGRSEDGLWWQVVCPTGVAGDSCWVVAESLFSEAINAISVPVALAPPTPTITPIPSPTPCVPGAPAGWTAYRVQPGDTLYDLALQTGVTAEQLAAINCLETDLLVVGRTFLLPTAAFVPNPAAPLPTRPVVLAGGVATRGSAGGGATGGSGESETHVLPKEQVATRLPSDTIGADILAVLAFSQPAGGRCPIRDELGIQVDPLDGRATLEVVQPFRVCPLGFTTPASVTISITTATKSDFITWYGGDDVKGWFWSLQPGSPIGVYTVTARLGEQVAPSTQITITRATSPTVTVISREVISGESVRLAVAGMQPGASLYLYEYVRANSKCKIFGKIGLPTLNRYGEGLIKFSLLPEDPVPKPPYYCVGTGMNSGNASTLVIGPTDYKIFRLLPK